MKIEKKLIKELVDYLSEFNLTEIEYQEGTKKIKVSKASRGSLDTGRASAIVSPTKILFIKMYFDNSYVLKHQADRKWRVRLRESSLLQ